jgi:hypothetical protein
MVTAAGCCAFTWEGTAARSDPMASATAEMRKIQDEFLIAHLLQKWSHQSSEERGVIPPRFAV